MAGCTKRGKFLAWLREILACQEGLCSMELAYLYVCMYISIRAHTHTHTHTHTVELVYNVMKGTEYFVSSSRNELVSQVSDGIYECRINQCHYDRIRLCV